MLQDAWRVLIEWGENDGIQVNTAGIARTNRMDRIDMEDWEVLMHSLGYSTMLLSSELFKRFQTTTVTSSSKAHLGSGFIFERHNLPVRVSSLQVSTLTG